MPWRLLTRRAHRKALDEFAQQLPALSALPGDGKTGDVKTAQRLLAGVRAALLWTVLLQKTATPPVIPDRVNLQTDKATVFITDIYSGPGLKGVPRGAVKSLRIVEYYFSRRGFGGLYGTLGMDGPWDVKRILGPPGDLVRPERPLLRHVGRNTPVLQGACRSCPTGQGQPSRGGTAPPIRPHRTTPRL